MASDIALQANDPEISMYLRDVFPYPYSEDHALGFINMVNNTSKDPTWAIYYQNNFAGIISLTLQHDIYRHSAEIGFWLGKQFHNKGIMTEAVNLVCNYSFSELNIYRIYAGVFEPNAASKQVLLKNGFEVEGIRKMSVLKNKKFLNDFLMAKVRT